MVSTSGFVDEEFSSVTASITYCVDTGIKPVNQTFESGNVMRNRVGDTRDYRVEIRDGREIYESFRLNENGFEFISHETAVKDFFNMDELKSVYYPEMEELIRKHTGAIRTMIFDHTLRSGDEVFREAKGIREPVKLAHNDFTDWSGPQRLRDILPDEAEALLTKRFAIIQVWRPIHHPIVADPLALLDSRTLSTGDLIAAERRYPHRTGETYQIIHNPVHEWYYFPHMQHNEALIFKVYDSIKDGRARFTGHTSFTHPNSTKDSLPRESIEVRCFAFFS